jgi:tetratricopeptide (TPR) repeat protein
VGSRPEASRSLPASDIPLSLSSEPPAATESQGKSGGSGSVREFLNSPNREFRSLAGVCCGFSELPDNGYELAILLQREDPTIVSLCELALWSTWFRAAGPQASQTLHRAMTLAGVGRTTEAIGMLDSLVACYPRFAEAYDQRGIVYSLREEHLKALDDFFHAVQLNPIHFAAMANLGHCCVELARFETAREWYLAALRVHPRLPGVRQILRRLGELL